MLKIAYLDVMSDIRGIEALRAELIQVMATTRDIELLRRALQVLRGGGLQKRQSDIGLKVGQYHFRSMKL